MSGSARNALMTSVGLMLLRRRLQRRGGAGAAVALVGLELFGPRILRVRRVLVWVLALTIVGGIVAAALWWRSRIAGEAMPSAATPAGPSAVVTDEPEPMSSEAM